jgi:hypothetical protein
MKTSFKEYPLAIVLKIVFILMRDRVIDSKGMNTKGEKVNRGKASVYSTGPINEDEIASMYPYSPNTCI